MENERNKLLFISSYPPRECGIATFTQDLISSLNFLFDSTFKIEVCALENGKLDRPYDKIVRYQMDVTDPEDVHEVACQINSDEGIVAVCVQHEFGLFAGKNGSGFLDLLAFLEKPVFTTFHTVLPFPNLGITKVVRKIAALSTKVITMTRNASKVLENTYAIDTDKITCIPHGTHLVNWKQPAALKRKYGLSGHKILATFGLLGPNKSIETTLKAMPGIIEQHPDVRFLILGKTHPELVKTEGEKYRNKLERYIKKLGIRDHVEFINKYLSLEELLEYLQLTDIYLFTSKDPNQAVSGTFAYALSCACPIVSTPIPHALEMLDDHVGRIIDFGDYRQLAVEVNEILSSEDKRSEMSLNAFHKTRMTIWENVANQYARTLADSLHSKKLRYSLPPVSMDHLNRMTADRGIIQFSSLGIPDLSSGFTLDDNARAMIGVIMHYSRFQRPDDLLLINKYFSFIKYCQRPDGRFSNYVDQKGAFHKQNQYTNLDDSNGRAIWALGYLIANHKGVSQDLVTKAIIAISQSTEWIMELKSPRAIAFVIKGLYYHNQYITNKTYLGIIEDLGELLLGYYVDSSDENWKWFEAYLTYENGVLPEAMILVYQITKKETFKTCAIESLDFLIKILFKNDMIKVVSNRGWMSRGEANPSYGEQPIDVTSTILALDTFHTVTNEEKYSDYLVTAFEWFLGNNHLGQIIYNPVSGGCYDGLEEDHPNLNEGAESTVCYLMARLATEDYIEKPQPMLSSTISKVATDQPLRPVPNAIVKRKEKVKV